MKTLKVCGWAVIFTVTLLLVACAPHTSKVAATDIMSGPDATMTQPITQVFDQDESAITDSQNWLDHRVEMASERWLDVTQRENALAERERFLNERTADLERRENALAINQSWLQERERFLNRRTDNLERRENALAINQSWLNERETRLAQQIPDLTKREDMMAFRESLAEAPTARIAELAPGETTVMGGHCYAKVVHPAEYKTVAVTKPIEVPKGENLPVLYQVVTQKEKVTDEQMRWEEVLCQDQLTTCRVSEIQRALYRGGYNPGPIDGVVGKQTMAAINDFQKDFDLTVTNHLTIETVRALDANF